VVVCTGKRSVHRKEERRNQKLSKREVAEMNKKRKYKKDAKRLAFYCLERMASPWLRHLRSQLPSPSPSHAEPNLTPTSRGTSSFASIYFEAGESVPSVGREAWSWIGLGWAGKL
jgi:hypothetical protein